MIRDAQCDDRAVCRGACRCRIGAEVASQTTSMLRSVEDASRRAAVIHKTSARAWAASPAQPRLRTDKPRVSLSEEQATRAEAEQHSSSSSVGANERVAMSARLRQGEGEGEGKGKRR